MLTLCIPSCELWDERTETFLTFNGTTIECEHSLASLADWESFWCKPFLTKEPKSRDETIDYIMRMCRTKNVPEHTFEFISDKNIAQVNAYIDAPMTAAWFSEGKKSKKSSEQVTAETIYYWMISLGIPTEYQYWHLNRLLALIRFCNIKNQPEKKRSISEAAQDFSAINKARRAALNSKG